MDPGVPRKAPGLETRDSLLVVVKWFVVTGVVPFLIMRSGFHVGCPTLLHKNNRHSPIPTDTDIYNYKAH